MPPPERNPYMSTLMHKILFSLTCGLLIARLAAADGPSATTPKEATQASKAVRVGGLDFQVVAATRWLVPPREKVKLGIPTTTISLALRVTNHNDRAANLWLPGCVHVCLKDAAGKELPVFGGADGRAASPPPVLIAPDKSADISRDGRLHRERDSDALVFWGADEDGFFWEFHNLKPGRYSVEIRYENTRDEIRLGNKSPITVLWVGKATTKPLAVEIVDQPAAANGPGQLSPASASSLRLAAAAKREQAAPRQPLDVRVRVVRTTDEKPATAPEKWVAEAVMKEQAKELNRPHMRYVSADSAWVPLAMDKPATIKGQEVTVRATARSNDRIVIALGLSTGSAHAISRVELEAKAGARKVHKLTTSGNYLIVEVAGKASS